MCSGAGSGAAGSAGGRGAVDAGCLDPMLDRLLAVEVAGLPDSALAADLVGLRQVAGRGAVGFGGRDLGPICLESGGVDGAVAGQEPSQLVGVEVPAEEEGQEQRVANLLWAGLLPEPVTECLPSDVGEPVRPPVPGADLGGLDQPVRSHGREFTIDLAAGQAPDIPDRLLGGVDQVPAGLRAVVQKSQQRPDGCVVADSAPPAPQWRGIYQCAPSCGGGAAASGCPSAINT